MEAERNNERRLLRARPHVHVHVLLYALFPGSWLIPAYTCELMNVTRH